MLIWFFSDNIKTKAHLARALKCISYINCICMPLAVFPYIEIVLNGDPSNLLSSLTESAEHAKTSRLISKKKLPWDGSSSVDSNSSNGILVSLVLFSRFLCVLLGEWCLGFPMSSLFTKHLFSSQSWEAAHQRRSPLFPTLRKQLQGIKGHPIAGQGDGSC